MELAGVEMLAEYERVVVDLPANLVRQIDGIAAKERSGRSEFIRKAAKHYIDEKERQRLKEELRAGYQEMAELNLRIAQESFHAEDDGFRVAASEFEE